MSKYELNLYADDFRKYGDWIAICMALDVPPQYSMMTIKIDDIIPGMNEDLSDFEE